MKIKQLLFLLLFCSIGTYAQEAERDNPLTISGMHVKKEDSFLNSNPNYAGYYTGKEDVVIPLFDFKPYGFDFSINLSYDSRGIKVEQYSEEVGLGWTLNYGGYVSRTVNGLPDESEYGYCGDNKKSDYIYEFNGKDIGRKYLYNFGKRNWDSKPDIFTFKALSKSGFFALNKDCNAVMLPKGNFDIKSNIGLQSGFFDSFKIVDEEGGVYNFNCSEKERRTVKSYNGSGGVFDNFEIKEKEDIYESNNKWFLSWAKNINGDTIWFKYKDIDGKVTNVYNNWFQEVKTYKNNIKPLGIKKNSTEVVISYPKIIDEIIFPEGSIEFKSSFKKGVRKQKAIDEIIIKDLYGNVIRSFEFQYEYVKSLPFRDKVSERLFLRSVTEIGSEGNRKPSYEFEYNTKENLPAYESYDYDHWGYYNDCKAETYIPRLDFANQIIEGASREPYQERTKANILEKIIHPSGMAVKYNYGLNKLHDGTLWGGLRIDSVQYYDHFKDINPVRTKRIYYNNSGATSIKPEYGFDIPKIGSENDESLYFLILYSKSYIPVFDCLGRNIEYSDITIVDNGITKVSYTDIKDYPDKSVTGYLWGIFPYNGYPLVFGPNEYIDKSGELGVGFNGWNRGLLKEVSFMDNKNILKSRITNEYVVSPNKIGSLLSLSVVPTYPFKNPDLIDNMIRYNYGVVNLLGYNLFLKKEISENFYDNSIVRKETCLDYNDINLVCKKTVKTNIDSISTEYIYANDVYDNMGAGVAKIMVDSNYLSYPIEEIIRSKGSVINGHVTDYYVEKGLLHINAEYRYDMNYISDVENHEPLSYDLENSINSSKLKMTDVYKKYDNYGNPLVYENYKGDKEYYIWGYGYNNLIAKISGDAEEGYNSLFDKSGTDVEEINRISITKLPDRDINLRKEIKKIRDAFPDLYVESSTYKPLIGNSSETDINGRTVYYDYDEYGNQIGIKDHNRDVIERNIIAYRGNKTESVINRSYKVSIKAIGNGRVLPDYDIYVPDGTDKMIDLLPENNSYGIDDIIVNGVSVKKTEYNSSEKNIRDINSYILENIDRDYSVEVKFSKKAYGIYLYDNIDNNLPLPTNIPSEIVSYGDDYHVSYPKYKGGIRFKELLVNGRVVSNNPDFILKNITEDKIVRAVYDGGEPQSGLITDGSGNPVAGVKVEVCVDSYGSLHVLETVTTGADGRFKLSKFYYSEQSPQNPESFAIRVSHSGYTFSTPIKVLNGIGDYNFKASLK
jgi:hypothetical protein